MGRKTWESIPENHRPLKDRINIVISSTSSTSSASAYFQPSLEAAFQLIDTLANVNNDNIFIIGGERLYTEAIERTDCEKIYVTEIYGSYECERFFPEIPASFILTNVSKFKSENNTYYRNLIYYNTQYKDYQLNTIIPWHNTEEYQYLDCLQRILTLGQSTVDRTEVGTFSLFGESFKYDLSNTFPVLTTKRQFVRGIFEELQFYLSGKTDNAILQEKKIHIWDGNTSRDFLDTHGLGHYPDNDMGETYGFNFRHYGAKYMTCKEDYTGKGFDQLAYAIDLIKNNPSSRRIIIDIWNGSTINNAALPPCLCKYQFYVNKPLKRLDLMIYIRSSDFFLANNWNTCTGAFFVHMICALNGIDLTPGMLTVVTGDTHIYKTHIDQVRENLRRTPRPYPKLVVKCKRDNIEDFQFGDMHIIGYNPHPNISASMAV